VVPGVAGVLVPGGGVLAGGVLGVLSMKAVPPELPEPPV